MNPHEKINWLESLTKEVVEDEDRILFKEAADCYKNGLHRAAYIMAWVTLVESLKRKIDFLATLDDTRSIRATDAIRKLENERKSTDKIIYEKAKECEIITDIEFQTVDFLWQKRCVFAHPYNHQPSLEELDHIFSQVISISLSKQNLFGTEYIQELITLLEKPHITGKGMNEIAQFAERKINRIKPSVYPRFYKELLYKIGMLVDDPDRFLTCRRYRAFIIAIFERVGNEVEKPDWVLESRVEKFPYAVWFGAVSVKTWSLFPKKIKELLFRYLLTEKDEHKFGILSQITIPLIDENLLEKEFLIDYINLCNNYEFEKGIEYYPNNHKFLRIINELNSYAFDKQTKVIHFLRSEDGKETISLLDDKQKILLGRILRYSEYNGSWSTESYISNITSSLKTDNEIVIAGIILGHFIDSKNGLRIGLDFNKIYKLIKLINLDTIKVLQSECEAIQVNSVSVDKQNREDKLNESLLNEFRSKQSDPSDPIYDMILNLITLLANNLTI